MEVPIIKIGNSKGFRLSKSLLDEFGSEIKKTRPCVIISPDEINDNLRTITVSPMRTKSKNYPTKNIRTK